LAIAAAGDTAEAIKVMDKARKADENFGEAHYQYGLLLSRTSSLSLGSIPRNMRATAALNRAIDLDGDNAMAYLELGNIKLKTPGLRIAAEQSFNRALDVAKRSGDKQAIANINFQLGQIYDRRYQSFSQRQQIEGDIKILNPLEAQYEPLYVERFLKENAVKIPDSGELDAGTAEEYYREALKAEPGHIECIAALATMLYDRQRYAEMAALTRDGIMAAPTSSRVGLARGLALWRLHDYVQASNALEKAVTLMSDREREMVASLSPIIRPNDQKEYEKLDAETKVAYDKAYWNFSDPLYITNLNEERVAFLARVAYSDLFFTTPPDPVIRGALTDRGEIVLRYGEPPVIAKFAPDVQMKNDGETVAALTTLWWYPESKLKFVFVGAPTLSTARYAGDFASYAKDLRYTVPVHYDHLADGLSIDTIPLQIARFRGDNPANTRIEMHAAMPTAALTGASAVSAMPIENAFIIMDPAFNRLVDARDTVRVSADEKAARSREWVRQFHPGEYEYSVEALEPQAMRSARARGSMQIVSFPAGEFALSDVLIGTNLKNETADIRKRDDLSMTVVADNSLDPGQPLGLYWESYGAKPSKDGTVHLKIDISLTVLSVDRAPAMHVKVLGAIADVLGISAEGEKKVTQSYERTVAAPPESDDRILHAIQIVLDGAPAAEYLLEISVTDLETGKKAHTTHALHVRRPQ
jgi:GWxTD domain-containing protein